MFFIFYFYIIYFPILNRTSNFQQDTLKWKGYMNDIDYVYVIKR